MLVDKKTLNKIKELGLNSYEAKIWTALLSRGVSTAGEISDIANVPRSRSYDVLESLEKKGFIIMKVGKPIQYIAVPPEEVLNRVKKDVRREAEEQVEVLEDFEESNLLDQLNDLHAEGIENIDPTEITGYVKGRTNIRDHINMLLKNAEEQVLISTTENGTEQMSENLTRALNKAERNGVQLRISSPSSSESIAARDNTQIKSTGLDGRFMVVDSNTALFFITDEDTHPNYETAVWVESPYLAGIFEQTFQQAWKLGGAEVEARLKTEIQKKAKK